MCIEKIYITYFTLMSAEVHKIDYKVQPNEHDKWELEMNQFFSLLMGHKQIATWQGKPEPPCYWPLHYPVRKRLQFVGTQQ